MLIVDFLGLKTEEIANNNGTQEFGIYRIELAMQARL